MAQQTTQSDITTNHDTIKNCAEERGGKPARVKEINFPDETEESLESISWDQFFREFEENNLSFLYQKETQDGGTSRFNKLVDRDTI